jgi:hypothetical protein
VALQFFTQALNTECNVMKNVIGVQHLAKIENPNFHLALAGSQVSAVASLT